MAPFQQTTLPAHLREGERHKLKDGAPTLYRHEYCQLVIDFMAQGYSLTAFAGHIRVSRDAVYDWIRAHKDFSLAVTTARAARVTALEGKLLTAHRGAEAAAAIFALKNADPVEWREVREVKHQHDHTLRQLTDAQLHEIAAQKAGPGDVIEAEYEVTGQR